MSEKDAGTATFRALDILTAIAVEESPIGVPELCSRLGLPKPTVHRLCQKLEGEKYLAREPDGRRFAPGPKLLRLGFGVISSSTSAERRMILEKLVEHTGETCNFVTRAGVEVLYLDRVEARWPLRMHLEPGSRVPMHCTASGKLFLSSLRAAQRQRILASLNLKRFTPNTLTDIPSLEREFNRILERGYSVDDQEFLEGLCALAVPVRDSGGRILAALACHGPMPRFTLERAVSLLPYFNQASEKLASTLPG